MTVVTIGIVGITSVLLAVQLKGTKSEYGIYLVMAAGCFMFFYGAARLESIVEGMRRLQEYVKDQAGIFEYAGENDRHYLYCRVFLRHMPGCRIRSCRYTD